MKKVLSLFFIFQIIYSVSTAQIKLLDFIAPRSSATNPTHIDSLGKGGYIPTPRRMYGMLVYVQVIDSVYKLGSQSIDNSNWISIQFDPTTKIVSVSNGKIPVWI